MNGFRDDIALRSQVFPGWGHRALGQRRSLNRFLNASGLFMSGASGFFLASRMYHDAAAAGTQASMARANRYEKGSLNIAAGFLLAWGLLSAYAMIDAANSPCLTEFQ